MRSILGILLLGLLALVGSWLLGKLSRGRTGLGPLSSGMLFLPLGVLLGPAVSGVLDAKAVADLELIKILGLGWIGFLFGLHLEWRLLKRMAARLYLLTAAQSLAAMLAVFAMLVLVRFHAADAGSAATALVAGPLILAACAAGSAPNRAFWLAARRRPDSITGNTLAAISSLDDLPGLLLFGVFFALASKPGAADSGLGGLLWLPLSIGLGFAAALLLREILPQRTQPQTSLALILGAIAFFSGAAGVLRLSPLFLGVAGGAAFANLSVRKESVFEVLEASERTIYLLFLLAVGALWDPSRAVGLLWVAALYVAARGLAKIGLSALLIRLGRSPNGATPSRWMGLGLLGQGGLVLAMALDYQRAFHGNLISDVLSVLIEALLLNELLAWPAGLWLARRKRPE